MSDYVQTVFDYYRETGFPYYPTDNIAREKDFQKLKNYDHTSIIEDDCVKQTMHGLALSWSYFPHAWEVKCNNKKTPMDIFNDDSLFRKAIIKRIKYGTYMSDSGMRKTLRTYSGVQSVSNFRPTAAAGIYHYYNAENVWDMSGGWGGRMLGAIVSNVKHYITTEPSEETVKGLENLKNDFGKGTTIEIHKMGAEDFRPDKNSLDFCFTSPPYFDTEKYSNEQSQSYVKFPDKTSWCENFLYPMFSNCYYGLKPNKLMVINIANTSKHKDLEEQTIKMAERAGFKHINTQKLLLSAIIGSDRSNRKHKFEPIFIFARN